MHLLRRPRKTRTLRTLELLHSRLQNRANSTESRMTGSLITTSRHWLGALLLTARSGLFDIGICDVTLCETHKWHQEMMMASFWYSIHYLKLMVQNQFVLGSLGVLSLCILCWFLKKVLLIAVDGCLICESNLLCVHVELRSFTQNWQALDFPMVFVCAVNTSFLIIS